MVFFDWDSSRLSPASLNVITQAVTAFRSTGKRPRHGDRPHRYHRPGKLQHGAVAPSRETR